MPMFLPTYREYKKGLSLSGTVPDKKPLNRYAVPVNHYNILLCIPNNQGRPDHTVHHSPVPGARRIHPDNPVQNNRFRSLL